jgi:hypothetical protein
MGSAQFKPEVNIIKGGNNMNKQQSLEVARKLLSRFIGEFYAVDRWDQLPDGFCFQSKKCAAPEILGDLGLADRKDLLCEAHEKYWQIALKELNPNINFQLKNGLARGENFCEWTVKLPGANR